MPITASGRIGGAGAAGGRVSGMPTATTARPASDGGGAGRGRAAVRPLSGPLQTRKLRWRPRFTNDTSSLPVSRHQAGKSPSTEISVERNSRS
jgi:hypothetical protein